MTGTVPNVSGSEVLATDPNNQQGGSVTSQNSNPGNTMPLFQEGFSNIQVDSNTSGNSNVGGTGI